MTRENRLAGELSPYLLQHRLNPVDWYPWGEEAFARARAEQRPIFLSVGYSACHWCHVMERESFEDEEVARFLNDRFVSIKVDREERPDVDEVYMRVTQMLTGGGGWPMSVFLTPEKAPFFAGTYYPKEPRPGVPGFLSLLEKIDEAWRTRRADVERSAAEIARALAGAGAPPAPPRGVTPTGAIAGAVVAALERVFDMAEGGFGGAPKFPPHHALRLLIELGRERPEEEAAAGGRPQRAARALAMATITLEKMAAGGIHDHVGGGFARYSVDAAWHVPHFEKMLYDNAMLARAYLDAHAATGNERFKEVAEGIFGWALREMADPEGGFYSALDADSEGVEGKFYVWTPEETAAALGEEEAEAFDRAYDVTAAGNFERGTSIPRLTLSGADPRPFAAARRKLLEARERRVRPALDDKVLTAWNGLMIGALARGAEVLGERRLAEAAARAARFLLSRACDERGRLLRSWRKGKAGPRGYLDDHAFLADGLLDLHEATGEGAWLEAVRSLAGRLLADFEDPREGGFFFTAHDAEPLLFRAKDPFDGALPSGNAVAARALVRLARASGEARYAEAADRLFRSLGGALRKAPTASLSLAGALLLRGEVKPAGAAAPAETAAPVTAILSVERDRSRPGASLTAVLELDVAPSFHLAAPLLGATLTSDIPIETGEPLLPEPETAALDFAGAPAKVYRGRLEVRMPFRLAATGGPCEGTVRVAVRYQACDERRCLLPAEAHATCDLKVIPRDTLDILETPWYLRNGGGSVLRGADGNDPHRRR